jgi:hypothetical protein
MSKLSCRCERFALVMGKNMDSRERWRQVVTEVAETVSDRSTEQGILHDVACVEIYCYMGMHYGVTEQYTMEKLLMHGAFNLSLSAPITSSVHKYRSDIFTLLFPRNMQREKAFFFS